MAITTGNLEPDHFTWRILLACGPFFLRVRYIVIPKNLRSFEPIKQTNVGPKKRNMPLSPKFPDLERLKLPSLLLLLFYVFFYYILESSF